MVGVLVGRDDECGQLAQWVDEARSGSPRVVLVTGDAGIGKTTLVAAAADDADVATTAVGRSTELEGAPPFRPWRQVLRTMESESMLDPVADDGEHDRFARFDAIVARLSTVAAEGGLLLVFEDAHRADPPSIRLLVHLAESLDAERVCLVMTARGRVVEQSDAFRAALPALTGQRGSRRLELSGLDADAVRAIAGAGVGDDAVERLVTVTRGNPLFVTALAQHLIDGGDPLRLPGSVVDLVRARVQERSPSCIDVLRLGAVIGREFAAGLVASALGSGAMPCLEAIAEAESAGLVEPTDRPGWFRFVHVVVRDAVEHDLGARTLAESHRRVAVAIETYEGSGEEHVADLARHWDAASVLGDAAVAAGWCERAAVAADRRLAWEGSARLYDRAVELDGPGSDPIVRHRRSLGSARARLHVDDIAQTAQRCAQAAEAARPSRRGRPP